MKGRAKHLLNTSNEIIATVSEYQYLKLYMGLYFPYISIHPRCGLVIGHDYEKAGNEKFVVNVRSGVGRLFKGTQQVGWYPDYRHYLKYYLSK